MKKNTLFFILAFIEGGVVMVAELCSAKLLAPYFGTAVHVWAATLAMTLGGLMTGYFLGGTLSQKGQQKSRRFLFIALLISSFLLLLTPFIAPYILKAFINWPLELGALGALAFFLFPVLVGLGCTSPLIITITSAPNTPAGVRAGQVYAISTLGGILFTLIYGFYCIPVLGIKISLISAGLLLGIATVIFSWITQESGKRIMTLAGVGLIMLGVVGTLQSRTYNKKFNVLYESDGLLGNIKVIEHTSEDFTSRPILGRGLVVNNTLQSYMDVKGPGISIWAWSHFLPAIASIYPANSKDLIIGLGGGTLYKQLNLLDHQVEAVEIDQRIKDLAFKYFKLPKESKVAVQDARNFIKTSNNKYDIIFYDAFLGESVPEHLLTKEGFAEAKSVLSREGSVVVNFYGFLTGENGYAARSVIQTLQDSGFKITIFTTPGDESYRNLIIHGKLGSPADFSQLVFEEIGKPPLELYKYIFNTNKALGMGNAEVLVDDKPNLSHYYAKAAKSWRVGYNEIYTKKLYK